MLIRGAVAGLVAGIASSCIVTFLGGMAAAAGPSDLAWMVLILTIPTILAGVSIAYLGSKVEQNKYNGRVLALVIAFVSVTFAGAVMAPFVQVINHGWKQVNVSGYLEWGPLYGVLMIPLSYPIARLLVKAIWVKADSKQLVRTAEQNES